MLIEKKLSYQPNLPDYEKIYREFGYKTYERELVWFGRGKLNAAYNAIDRHIGTHRENKVALFWEGENEESKKYTFRELYEETNKVVNILRDLRVAKGDRVFIFLPRVPELFISFLGILKRGAVAGTLFSAFGPEALYDRLFNSGAKVLITNEELYERVEKIRSRLPKLKKVIIVGDSNLKKEGLISFEERMAKVSRESKVCLTSKDDLAFMLYTSGTTGKPKGVAHRHYAILHEYLTAKWVLDIKDSDTYWCTADPGWVTGIAYEILGTWANGASTVVHAGRFDADKWYRILEKYSVSVWYTAPTAIRMLMAAGDSLVKKYNLGNLRHLCSVGEPLNPEAVYWGSKVFGKPFHDNYWQTESGGMLVANYPSMDIKPGSMGKSVPGVTASVVDEKGKEVPEGIEGDLVIKPGWASMMVKIWKRPRKYKSYFRDGWYITGDRAYRDKDGYFWFIGRSDDVIKTAGERVGPFEVESALIEHPAVVEAGVVGKPDPVRGEIVKAFVVLKKGIQGTDSLKDELSQFVKKHLSAHAYPREIEFMEKLPKTRSGKIMRRLLKAKEMGLPLGDTSTLEEY